VNSNTHREFSQEFETIYDMIALLTCTYMQSKIVNTLVFILLAAIVMYVLAMCVVLLRLMFVEKVLLLLEQLVLQQRF